MNPVYRVWWRALMDLRHVVRFLAERFPHLAGPAVRIRSLLHLVVGNIAQVTTAGIVALLWSLPWPLWVEVLIVGLWWLLLEAVHHLVMTRSASPALVWLAGWREAWRVRRRWPADWAAVAAKTTRVQAEVGTSKEPIASARLRPIADHPKLAWWPRIEWPVVSWWVGPPPGRSFTALDELLSILAANISHCIDVALDYERESDSYGRLVVTFADPLAAVVEPSESAEILEFPEMPEPLPPAADDIEEEPAHERPALRVVPDDEWEVY